jgi:hypothetical protein
MDKYLLITENRDYADEFDTHGFTVMTQTEFDKAKEDSEAILNETFTKFSEEEFLKRQKERKGLPYMYGGYGKSKKYTDQYDAPYSAYLERFGKYGGLSYSISFGTNEEHSINSLQEFWNDIKIKEITEQEYNTIKKLFGSGFGFMCFPLEN